MQPDSEVSDLDSPPFPAGISSRCPPGQEIVPFGIIYQDG
jgi:hypothetical protein